MPDTYGIDALRQTPEPPTPQQLTQIRERAARLAAIPLQTRAGDNCIVADLIASAADVQWLLAVLEQQQTLTTGLRQHWGAQAEHSKGAFPARSQEQAQQLAAMYSRTREPGCLPTPYHVVTRLEGDWQRADTAPVEQQPEDGDRG